MTKSGLRENLAEIRRYLQQVRFFRQGEQVEHFESAGEGNMNLTLRVSTNQRSFILKQSPPWVAKYPHIPAPADRVVTESLFYQRIARSPYLSSQMPALLWVDPEENALILEDLGYAPSCNDLYRGGKLTKGEMNQLIDFLVELHAGDFSPKICNSDMRALNHQHIFVLPLSPDNPVALDAICPGLSRVAQNLSAHEALKRAVHQLGRLYLSGSGPALLHGDFYPGSWLRSSGGVKFIDPEFCFHGPPEFDIGVLLGHLVLSGQLKAFQSQLLTGYGQFNQDLARAFAGVEIIRRLLGVAQLPLVASLKRRVAMLERAKLWVTSYGA